MVVKLWTVTRSNEYLFFPHWVKRNAHILPKIPCDPLPSHKRSAPLQCCQALTQWTRGYMVHSVCPLISDEETSKSVPWYQYFLPLCCQSTKRTRGPMKIGMANFYECRVAYSKRPYYGWMPLAISWTAKPKRIVATPEAYLCLCKLDVPVLCKEYTMECVCAWVSCERGGRRWSGLFVKQERVPELLA